jgi:GNAT superfamily N-acetyltransferase
MVNRCMRLSIGQPVFTKLNSSILPLWEQLNAYHPTKTSYFKTHYERMTFEDRRSSFHKLPRTVQVRLDRAIDTATGKYDGYCVISLSAEKKGEVESLFVDKAYRPAGIGTAPVTRWLAVINSLVASGNGYVWLTATRPRGCFTGSSGFTRE